MSKQQGYEAESFVAQQMEQNGYTIIARNYSSRWGEIDLIGLISDTLAFVEVKQRSKEYFDMSELVTLSKQKKIIATAKLFLASHEAYHTRSFRFDVALVHHAPRCITYIPNAFAESDAL